jgi:ATP-binding cassette subfamily B protein
MAAEEPAERVGVVATLRRASGLVPGFWHGMGVTVALAAVGAFGRLVLPVLVQRTINDAFDSDPSGTDVGSAVGSAVGVLDRVDTALVLRYCLIALAAVVITQLATRAAAYRLGSWSEWLMASMRRRCIDRFLDISLDQHAAQKKGVLVARVTTDVESIARFFEWGAVSWLINSLIVVILSVYLVVTDARLGLLAIVVASPVVLVMKILQRHLLQAYALVRHHVGTYLGRTAELVGGAAVIRAYRAEQVMRRGAVEAAEDRRRAQVRTGVLGALLFPMGELFATLAVTAVVLSAVAIGPGGGLSDGTVVAIVFAVIRLLDPVSEISENIDQTQLAVAGLSRVLDVIDLPVELAPPTRPVAPPPGRLGLRLEGVWYAYPSRPDRSAEDPGVAAPAVGDDDGAETAAHPHHEPGEPPVPEGSDSWTLEEVSVEVPAGSSLAIVGATGSGKSTIARLLVRLADPQIGRVLLGGVDLRDVADDELRHRVQLVPQEPFLFDGTISDNLGQARPRTGGGAVHPGADPGSDPGSDPAAAARRIGLADWLDGLPQGLGTRVGERGGGLSAGERQLVALLRAELMGPDVLVLDEATSSVDAALDARLAATIAELARGRTLVVIAHRLSTAARADRIAVMELGRLVELGSHDELVAAGGTYARMAADWRAGVGA